MTIKQIILKELKNFVKKTIKEESLIRHKKVTYDDKGNIIKTEVQWYDKKIKIKGRNFDSEIPELNLTKNQEIYPCND